MVTKAPQSQEDQTVRQYRYLLRTAPLDALEHAHVDALNSLGPRTRQVVLETVQSELLTGTRLIPDDITALAHLVTAGERHRPGALIAALPTPTLHDLADSTIHSEAALGLLGGYAGWDGSDPQSANERDESEYAQRWHAALQTRDGTAPGMNGALGGGA